MAAQVSQIYFKLAISVLQLETMQGEKYSFLVKFYL